MTSPIKSSQVNSPLLKTKEDKNEKNETKIVKSNTKIDNLAKLLCHILLNRAKTKTMTRKPTN